MARSQAPKLKMFRHCKVELVQLTEDFEFPPSSEGVVAYGSTPRVGIRMSKSVKDVGRPGAIEIRV